MNDDPCVIQINGTNYYVACNSMDYIIKDGNDLINTSNSSITLYYSYPVVNDSSSGYPRIQASANQKFYYRQSYTANSQQLQVTQYKVINRHTSNDVLLMIVLICVSVFNFFKR